MNDIDLHFHPPADNSAIQALPHSVGPEKSVLSSLLQDPQEFMDMAIERGLSVEHFYLPSHATLYGVLCSIHEAGKQIELVSLIQTQLDGGKLEQCGGPRYVTELYTYSPNPGHFLNHLQIVKDKHALRGMIRAANQTIADVYAEPEDPFALLDEAERRFMAIREGQGQTEDKGNREAIQEIIAEFQRRVKGETEAGNGLATGFTDLDRMSGGLKPGEVYVIAARPSMGKTSFMMNIVEHVCLDLGKPCHVFSCEMSKKQLLDRLIYARAKFAKANFSRGHNPTKPEMIRTQTAAQQILEAPLVIDDNSSPTINEIRAKARRSKRKHGTALIAIDYLQLCRSTSKQANGSREREIAEISAGIKGLAKDLNIPIILLAQINRESEKRTGKAKGKPRMSDLRESGAIEQDADFIGLLTRPAQFADTDEERKELAGKAELIVAKNRNGATGSCPLVFIEELMRFETGAPITEEAAPATRKDRFGNDY